MAEELKACPFCGHEAMVAVTEKTGLATVACVNCECEMGWFSSRADAAAAWNCREGERDGRDS